LRFRKNFKPTSKPTTSYQLRTTKFGQLLTSLRLKFLELRYLPHIQIRLVHDKTYAKNKTYKSWTDKKYSSTVHKVALTTFIISFVFFQGFQYLFPYFNLWNPNNALAGSSSKTWTTTADFSTGQTPNVTNDGKFNIGSNTGDDGDGSIRLADNEGVGTGADGALVVDGTTAENNTLNGVLITGGPFNSSNPLVLDTKVARENRIYNFTNVTLQNNAFITHTKGIGVGTAYPGLKIFATGAVTIGLGSLINADGKGGS
jgi:hypothetical protein